MTVTYEEYDELCQRFRSMVSGMQYISEEEIRLIYLSLAASKAQLVETKKEK